MEAEAFGLALTAPDLNIIENLCERLKHAVHAWLPKNISELEVLCRVNENTLNMNRKTISLLEKSIYKLWYLYISTM